MTRKRSKQHPGQATCPPPRRVPNLVVDNRDLWAAIPHAKKRIEDFPELIAYIDERIKKITQLRRYGNAKQDEVVALRRYIEALPKPSEAEQQKDTRIAELETQVDHLSAHNLQLRDNVAALEDRVVQAEWRYPSEMTAVEEERKAMNAEMEKITEGRRKLEDDTAARDKAQEAWVAAVIDKGNALSHEIRNGVPEDLQRYLKHWEEKRCLPGWTRINADRTQELDKYARELAITRCETNEILAQYRQERLNGVTEEEREKIRTDVIEESAIFKEGFKAGYLRSVKEGFMAPRGPVPSESLI
jgi:predicted  nucleic acid-binding Zn-ribbon protein